MTASRAPNPVPSRAAPRPGLSVVRDFGAAPERVWRAWVDPEEMVRWLGPVECPASEVRADVRAGGTWQACLEARDGSDLLRVSGRYLDVEATRLLRFTFQWEGENHEDGPGVETVVTVAFERTDRGGTRLTLTQEALANQQSADGHARGWSSTLDRLAERLASEGERP